MRSLQMILICLSALGFVLAVITSLACGPVFFGVTAEGFSFASADLSLIAIALSLYGKSKE